MEFDGTLIQETDYTTWFDIVRGGPQESSEMAGVDTVIPSSPGFVPMPREARQRRILLAGWIHETSASAFVTAWKALHALFDPTAGAKVLEIPLADSTTATILAQPLNIVPDEEGVIAGVTQRFAIELISGAPDWTIT